MVQEFCLVSLTISNRKTSYRSLKQTAGSTSCLWTPILVSHEALCTAMMQFHPCRKQKMMSSIRLQQYDVTSYKQCLLTKTKYWCKRVSTCYNHRKFGKVSFVNEGVIAFSKKVHVFLRHPVHFSSSSICKYAA